MTKIKWLRNASKSTADWIEVLTKLSLFVLSDLIIFVFLFWDTLRGWFTSNNSFREEYAIQKKVFLEVL